MPQVVLRAICGIGAVAILIERVWLGHDLPLWIDETWTAVIAMQPGWQAFWHEAWLDVNAPLYYAFMALWVQVAGISNSALRLPSMVFMIVASILPLLWRPRELSQEAAITWSALLFFWWPGMAISVDARTYALLLLLSVAQTIAYVRLMQAPTQGATFVWTALASISLLTHYYAIYVIGIQGLIYLWMHRKSVLRTWPAALLFVPSIGEMFHHLPRVTEYARPDARWYEPIQFGDAWNIMQFTFGPPSILFDIALILIIGGGIWAGRRYRSIRDETAPETPALYTVGISAAITLVAALIIGAVQATLTDRYLTPLVPSMLLGIVLLAGRSVRAHIVYAFLVGLYLAAALTPVALAKYQWGRSFYGYEPASDFLLKARPTEVVFAWDHPAAKILDPNSLRQMGGFFFLRAGQNVETIPMVLMPGQNANKTLMHMSVGDRPAIIWLYDLKHRSAARSFPPTIDLKPNWRCEHVRLGSRGSVACAPAHLFYR